MLSGIPYFPLEVTLNEKFELIDAEFGIIGFGVITRLQMRIFEKQGYYCEFTNEVALLFSRTCGLGCNVVSEIVMAAVRRGIFNDKLYEKYQILTSPEIQTIYFEAVSRRKQFEIKKEYLLIDVTQKYKNVIISSENDIKNDKIAYISEQRKEEKSTGKKSIVKYTKEEESKKAENGKIRFAELVTLTQDEYDIIKQKKGEEDTATVIKMLNDYKKSSGHKYNNDFCAIERWVYDKLDEEKVKKAKQNNTEFKKKPPRYESKVDFDAEKALELSWNIIENTLSESEKEKEKENIKA
ncbi:MAG: hypothetical protein K0S55_1888 [Clostridia bacterium]|nr:hypothetical protein [Clostridia bacterium]